MRDRVVTTEPLGTALSEKLEERRSISCEVSSQFMVQKDQRTVGFKYIRDKQLRFVKWRSYDKKFWIDPAGVPLQLFNLDDLLYPETEMATITEGEFDAMAAIQAGVLSVVSVPNGGVDRLGQGDINPLEDTQFSYLWQDGLHLPHFKPYKRFLLAVDNDKAGRCLAEELAVRLGRSKCWIPKWPDRVIADLGRPAKDFNELLHHFGPDAIMDVVADAVPIDPNTLVPAFSIQAVKNPEYLSGWHHLDDNLRIVPPELFVVTGYPGSGKSQWVLNLMMNQARDSKSKCAYMQFEDNPQRNQRDLLLYAIHNNLGLDQDEKRYGEISDDQREAAAREWVNAHFFMIEPPSEENDPEQTLRWVEDRIEEAALRHGCKFIALDPWNEIEHAWGIRESETLYTNKALRHLKRLARKYNIALIIVAHPAKPQWLKSGPQDDIELMSLYDISGSSAWKNKADHGVVVHRLKDSKDSWIKIDKSKDHVRMGKPGIVLMSYNNKTAQYTFKQRGTNNGVGVVKAQEGGEVAERGVGHHHSDGPDPLGASDR